MRAPAMYSGTGGPGTLEMATLPAAGRRAAKLERPSSDDSPVMSQGEPVTGVSTPSTGFSSLTTALADSDDAWIALKRAGRSAISVARSTRIAETWLFISSLSAARRLTGTIAISDFFGSRSRSFRKRRSALLHIAMTTVLTVPPTRAPSALTSRSGTDSVLNERWLVIDSLKTVFGARPRFSERSPLAVRFAARALPAAPIAFTAVGSSCAAFRYCRAEFSTAACSSSVTPSW